jgi:hypothetical protein
MVTTGRPQRFWQMAAVIWTPSGLSASGLRHIATTTLLLAAIADSLIWKRRDRNTVLGEYLGTGYRLKVHSAQHSSEVVCRTVDSGQVL